MKKSKIKKLIEKLLGPEVTNIDNRLLELELKTGIKTLAEIDPLWYGEMSVKDAEHIKPDVSKMEITELPDDWCVKVTNENTIILTEWKKRVSDNYYDGNASPYTYIRNTGAGVFEIPEHHIEISFSDFERLVLKKEAEKSEELVVSKWYKRPHTKALFCVVGNSSVEPFEVYGFDNGGAWMINNNPFAPIQTWKDQDVSATKEEVEAALMNELAKKGYKEGTIIKSFNNSEYILSYVKPVFNPEFYNGNTDHFGIRMGGACIYANGIWAEIISQPEDNIQEVDFEIDFSVAGQLVISDSDNLILMTTGIHNKRNETFQAVTISTESSVTFQGENWKSWSKTGFSLLKKPITIKN